MDIRVKERLTGAVILVALIVLVVPELLSRPAMRPGSPAAASDEAPLRSVTLELGDEARSTAVAASDSAPVAPQSPQSAQSASTESVAPPAQVPPPQAPPQQAPRSARTPTTAHAARSTRVEPHDAARAPDGSPPVTASWSVQVGSFESRERADRFVHRLRAAGFTAFISESLSHGRKWYRVRVGPERDRVAARAMVVRLHSAGHAVSVVPPS